MKTREELLPPETLREVQKKFSQAMRMPALFDTGTLSFNSAGYDSLFTENILARGAQSGRERLAIYNEQYWYRLFTALQEDYPLLANTLGFWVFNQLVSAYLSQRPSLDPFLENLSMGFADFLHTSDLGLSKMELQIASIESALLRAFYAPQLSHLSSELPTLDSLKLNENTVLAFHAGFSLFAEDWNLVQCRNALHSGGVSKVVPTQKVSFWVVFQHAGRADCKEVNLEAFNLLTRLRSGKSIGEACNHFVELLDEAALLDVSQNIPRWFADWTVLKWFTCSPEIPA